MNACHDNMRRGQTVKRTRMRKDAMLADKGNDSLLIGFDAGLLKWDTHARASLRHDGLNAMAIPLLNKVRHAAAAQR